MTSNRLVGGATVALAIAFNIPYAILAASFDYPGILRQSAGTVLDRFAAAGPGLVLTWYGFMLSALALVPLSIVLTVTPTRLGRAPAIAILAAIAGALAGFAQAAGLSRWIFVVPGLAATHSNAMSGEAARVAAEHAFTVLNSYGGVAIGEHLGQLLTALFAVSLAVLQQHEGQRRTALAGYLTALTLAIGSSEGPALALGGPGDGFSLFTIAGFLALTIWLVATGAGLLRRA